MLRRGPTALASHVAAERGIPARCVECDADAENAQAERLEALDSIARRVAAGSDVRILCWCYPKRCHADDIAAIVRARASELWSRSQRKRVR